MKNKAKFLGMLLRNKRLNLNLELKDVAKGICAVSYLSKIELGQARPSEELVNALLSKLNLEYEYDVDFLNDISMIFDQVYEGIFFQNDISKEIKYLKQNESRILKGPLYLSFKILMGYLNDQLYPDLKDLIEYMDKREKAIYFLTENNLSKTPSLEKAKEIESLLQNSFGKLIYMSACLHNNQFEQMKSTGHECIVLSITEGNLSTLINANLLIATSYAVESHLTVAISYYERASRLIKNSIWPYLEDGINYNLGATYLEIGDLEKSSVHLAKVPRSHGFYLYHKLAYLAFAKGDIMTAGKEINDMKNSIGEDKTKAIIFEATAIQLQKNYESKPESLATIEKLISTLKETKHLGYLRFHKNIITKVFIAHRQYKKAFEFEQMLNNFPQ